MSSIYVPMCGETGGTMGPRGKLQTKLIKKTIEKAFSNIAEIKFLAGHYECCAFIKFSENNIIYVSTCDYRFFNQMFFVRIAKHMNDYTGEKNYEYRGFDNIINAINQLAKK